MSKICNIELCHFNHPYKNAFRCAWGDIKTRSGYYLTAESSEGILAIAELSPLEGFSGESLQLALESLNKVAPKLNGLSVPSTWAELDELLTALNDEFDPLASVSWALEMLLFDIVAKSASIPVHALLSEAYKTSEIQQSTASHLKLGAKVEVNALLNGSGQGLVEQFQEKQSQGFNTFKIKYNPDNQQQLIASLIKISDVARPPARFRIDANQSLTLDDCLRLLDELQGLNIEYIEEPLRYPDIDKLKAIKKSSEVDVALDESLQTANALEELIKGGLFGVGIIKPMLLGGYRSSVLLSQKLKAAGIDTVVTSTLETPVGLQAGLHLAHLIQLQQRQSSGEKAKACGFDTLGLFAKNFLNNRLAAHNGLIEIPAVDGLGFTSVEITDLIGSSES